MIHTDSFQQKMGFTLLELMVVLFIACTLTLQGLPLLNNFYQKVRWQQTLNTIEMLIHRARHKAITSGQHTRLCPYQADNTCGKTWQNGLSIFQDTTAFVHYALPPKRFTLTFSGFGRTAFILFNPLGFTEQNGHFTLEQINSHCHYQAFIYLRKSGHTHINNKMTCNE